MIIKNKSSRNILTLITGSTIAQAIPIAISPILTRLYTPEDFGTLALFTSLVTIFSVISTGRYEFAIILPKKESNAANIAALSLGIVSIISIMILIIILLTHNKIILFLNNPQIGPWLYFIPVAVFLTGIFNILNYYNTRLEKYKDISTSNINRSITSVFLQLTIHIFKKGVAGLIIGNILSLVAGNFKLLINILKIIDINQIKLSKIKALAKRYIKFPKYSIWTALSNTAAYNICNITIAFLFNAGTLGLYSISQRVLGTPTSLIGSAISQVYFQKASSKIRENKELHYLFITTLKRLLLIGFPIFLFIYIFSPYLFGLFFGEAWSIAGHYTAILTPFFYIRFVYASLSTTTLITERQEIGLFCNIGLLIIALSILLATYVIKLEFETFLYIYSLTNFFYYSFLILILKKLTKNEKNIHR
ncbi:oligosaccharide flippase family protein [Xenorhabdus bovienii]|uniref:lipopolysaccharide biosynthesis protein n=1 Tax=Xenorhabdus bovienii TaxID=40576 RepID=UPI0023B238D9|nr:oligosaccharide flippase family protein [Xenorhabdus bovienii]MDE9435963.1 oligosaccharide flippase family protein [Xenorhabdus bovienii]MDE9498055.1 oligosaccharide flippase family protein [Xenorhabdus bovienii]